MNLSANNANSLNSCNNSSEKYKQINLEFFFFITIGIDSVKCTLGFFNHLTSSEVIMPLRRKEGYREWRRMRKF